MSINSVNVDQFHISIFFTRPLFGGRLGAPCTGLGMDNVRKMSTGGPTHTRPGCVRVRLGPATYGPPAHGPASRRGLNRL